MDYCTYLGRSGHARGGSEAEGFRELAEAEPRLEDTALLQDFSRTFAAAILSTHDSIDVLRWLFLDGCRLFLASKRIGVSMSRSKWIAVSSCARKNHGMLAALRL